MDVIPTGADEGVSHTPQRRRTAVEVLILGLLSTGFLALFPHRPISVDLVLALLALALVLLNAGYTRTHIWGLWPVEVGRTAWRPPHPGANCPCDARLSPDRSRDRLPGSGLAWGKGKNSSSVPSHRRPIVLALGPAPADPLSVLPARPGVRALPVTPSAHPISAEWARVRRRSQDRHLDSSIGDTGRDPLELLISPLSPALAPGGLSRADWHDVLLLGLWLRSREPMECVPRKLVE